MIYKTRTITVLIVPYGIETISTNQKIQTLRKVLIVPYGIETFKKSDSFDSRYVLIVPYGIETSLYYAPEELRLSVNCTLWN